MVKKSVFAFMSVTAVTVISWGTLVASVWLPVDARVLPLARSAATVSAVALMLLLSLRWLRGKAMAYMLGAMLSQRAKSRQEAPTRPLKAVR